MKTFKNLRAVTRIVLLASLVSGGLAFAQAKPQAKPQMQKQKDYENLIFSVRGPELFRAHCAPCHGADGKGGGALAPALKAKSADLTVLAKNSGGKFPEDRVRRFISGDEVSISHGSRDMPVWGPIFHQIEEDQDFGNVRLQNLLKYIESIQQK